MRKTLPKRENYKGGSPQDKRIQKQAVTTNEGELYTRREQKRQFAEDRGRVTGKIEQGRDKGVDNVPLTDAYLGKKEKAPLRKPDGGKTAAILRPPKKRVPRYNSKKQVGKGQVTYGR